MNHRWIALSIAVIALLAYGWFASSLPGFSDNSYFHIRQAHEILQTGTPVFQDSLSYGGSLNLFVPAFDYLLAIVGGVIGIENAGRLLMALSFSSIIFLGYLITIRTGPPIAVLAAALIPVLWQQVGTITATLPALALGFLLLLAFINIEQRVWRRSFVPILFALVLISPLAIAFTFGLLVYLALAAMAGVRRVRGEHELIFFAFLFNVWFLIIFFKKALVAYGASIIWQNIPARLMESAFSQLTVLDAVVAVGVLPFIGGMYILYRHVFTEHERTVYVLMGLSLTAGALVWSRLIELSIGLQVLSVALVALLAFAVRDLLEYTKKTKVRWLRSASVIALVILVLFAGIPALNEVRDAPNSIITAPEQQALAWIAQNTPPETVVLGTLEEGHAITAIAQRPNVADSFFLMKPNAETRAQDIERILQTPFESEAVRLLKQYGVSVLLWTDRARTLTGRDVPAFAEDELCFPRLYNKDRVSVYGVACALEAS